MGVYLTKNWFVKDFLTLRLGHFLISNQENGFQFSRSDIVDFKLALAKKNLTAISSQIREFYHFEKKKSLSIFPLCNS